MALLMSAMEPIQITLGMSSVWMLGPYVLPVGVRLTTASIPQGPRFPSLTTETTEYQVMKFLNWVIRHVIEKLGGNPPSPNSSATLSEFICPSPESSFPPTPNMSPIKRDRSDYDTILNCVREIVCEEIVSIAEQTMEITRQLKGTSSVHVEMSEPAPSVSVSIPTAPKGKYGMGSKGSKLKVPYKGRQVK